MALERDSAQDYLEKLIRLLVDTPNTKRGSLNERFPLILSLFLLACLASLSNLAWHSVPTRYIHNRSTAGGRDSALWSYDDYLNSVS